MKTTKILTSAIVLSTLGLAAAPAVHAADHTETITSTGKIGFIEDNGTTDPTDPTNPGTPIDPTDPNPGTAGPLSIDYVSNFDFGSDNKISGDDKTYYAKPIEATDNGGNKVQRANYLQVTDKRGSNIGWYLTVKQGAQFNDGKADLDGAKLQMTNQTLNSKNMDLNNPSNIPAIDNATMTMTPGDDIKVLTAGKNQGMGTWTDAFGVYDAAKDTASKAVSLEVPGNSAKNVGSYTTDLTWTLSDVGL
ncbi:WxL domain-containing protein [Dellaglioa algida]|uniref:WxL domain-containing protein n=1 Tax=Dellaglioa algida TaxID=105612 RepID=A0A5C6MC12_9LACO|nr:WxL domain-containing protein [Dellaglioa algida]MDK1716940.1 WxL domain-containing protein [Dellaglioa algida]MDK1719714.1 WxL domain-containing protein [Dellaglioa algida]MDK1721825.1 WxL domain-containing protein [Dellaglioa algida]MDK1723057.1 WxL domain-containing protein [Dellaglioa algida]MDK1724676.1 WxL domain-containing protein [Dellaglioa algida]